ncbi:hypothetical protein GCM10009639_06250 [Kitasatospora putterlickiae]|uniref:Secreted protein n=1 Tax=Kitasatospora putterlickiae TaxID=221725 RepID=A0ABN1XLZ2_9ACTN
MRKPSRSVVLTVLFVVLLVGGFVVTVSARRAPEGEPSWNAAQSHVRDDYTAYWNALLASNESGDGSVLPAHAAGRGW